MVTGLGNWTELDWVGGTGTGWGTGGTGLGWWNWDWLGNWMERNWMVTGLGNWTELDGNWVGELDGTGWNGTGW